MAHSVRAAVTLEPRTADLGPSARRGATRGAAAASRPNSGPAGLLWLQRTGGNAAATALLQRLRQPTAKAVGQPSDPGARPVTLQRECARGGACESCSESKGADDDLSVQEVPVALPVQREDATPTVCDPGGASCEPGTVAPDGTPNIAPPSAASPSADVDQAPGISPAPDTNPAPSTDSGTGIPSGQPSDANPCFANFDITGASAVDKLSAAMCSSKGQIPDQIYDNLVSAVPTMVGLGIFFDALQFVPGANVVVDGVAVLELIKIGVEAGLNAEMAKSIVDNLGTFLGAANATSDEEIKAAGDALAAAVGESTVFVLLLLTGGKGEEGGAAEKPVPNGEYQSATKGKWITVTVGDAEGGEGGESTGPTHSDAQMSDGSPVAGEAESPDGTEEVKVGQDGKCEVCASPCKDIRDKYADALNANPDLEARLADAESIPDWQERAGAIARLLPDLEKASGRRGSELSGLAEAIVDDPEACKDLNWKNQLHDHHWYSQKWRPEFSWIDIEIDDFCITIMAKEHVGPDGIHKVFDWEGEWEDFFSDFPYRDLSKQEIARWKKGAKDLVSDLLNKADMAGLPYHAYRAKT